MKKLSCTYKCIKPISFDWLQNSIRFEWFCFFTKYVPRENLWVCFKSNNKNAKNDSFLIAFKTFNVCQEESQYLLCTMLLKHTNINSYKQSTLCHNSVNIIWWVASIFSWFWSCFGRACQIDRYSSSLSNNVSQQLWSI